MKEINRIMMSGSSTGNTAAHQESQAQCHLSQCPGCPTSHQNQQTRTRRSSGVRGWGGGISEPRSGAPGLLPHTAPPLLTVHQSPATLTEDLSGHRPQGLREKCHGLMQRVKTSVLVLPSIILAYFPRNPIFKEHSLLAIKLLLIT